VIAVHSLNLIRRYKPKLTRVSGGKKARGTSILNQSDIEPATGNQGEVVQAVLPPGSENLIRSLLLEELKVKISKIAALFALGLSASMAQAATYQLTNIVLEVPFGTVNSDTSPNLNVLGGFATLSNGTVTVSGAAWESLTANAVYTYSGDWSVEIGNGVNLSKLAESCTGTDAASACDSPRGLVGDWILGQLQDGTPCQYGDSQCFVNASVTGTTQVGIDELIIVRQTEFVVCPGGPPAACFNDGVFNNSKLTLTYTLIPVPAAVWFFVSGLGLLGWMRRRAAV